MTDGIGSRAAARLLIVHLAQRRIENARRFDQLIALAADIQAELRQDCRRLMDLARAGAPELRDLEAERLRALAPWLAGRFDGNGDGAVPEKDNGSGAPADAGYDAHLPSVAEMLALAGMPAADDEVVPLIAAAQTMNWAAATVAPEPTPIAHPATAEPSAVASDPADVDGLSPVRTAAIAHDIADELAPPPAREEDPADVDGLRPIKPAFLSPQPEPAAQDWGDR